ncbi:hypothetical protein BN1356_00508 [Streptococcus varani]|uniref:Uncharacterized protein n=1 Tax=Streptococcus varani TaxID=1608583 RepID=A0A0E4H4B3_9STRE|nr:hypothetical protein [Streptococcus varani]CQR24147.1 hypothetical protein BN1356_00508 [Streptococcus varani]
MKNLRLRKRTLLAVAGSVWLIAGFNVIKMGIQAYIHLGNISLINTLLSILIFLAFAALFYKMAWKHQKRILSYKERKRPFWDFFDLKSYLIMAFMMGGGIWLRTSGLAPISFIAFFYTGLGSALTLAGILFWKFYLTYQG